MQKYIIDKNTFTELLIKYYDISMFDKDAELNSLAALKYCMSNLLQNKEQIVQLVKDTNDIPIKILKDILTCFITSLIYSYKNIYNAKDFHKYLHGIISTYNLEEFKNNKVDPIIDINVMYPMVAEDKYIYYFFIKLQFIAYHLNVNNIRNYTDCSQYNEAFELRILYALICYSYIMDMRIEEAIAEISNSKDYICNTIYTLDDYDKLNTLTFLTHILYGSSVLPSSFNIQIIKKYVFQEISTQELITELQTNFKYRLDTFIKKNIISPHYLG